MRALTPQEINDAPEWAIEYYFDDEHLWYVNKKWGMAKILGRVRNLKRHSSVLTDAQPIPRKEFDISGYAFSEGGISVVSIGDDCLTLCVGHSEGDFTKEDVAAMANMLNVTPEDLTGKSS